MKIRTNIKAGGRKFNHNQTLVRDTHGGKKMKIRTNIRAGKLVPWRG